MKNLWHELSISPESVWNGWEEPWKYSVELVHDHTEISHREALWGRRRPRLIVHKLSIILYGPRSVCMQNP